MSEIFRRTEMLFGSEAVARFEGYHVALFGVGGVGGYVAEALGRSGIGEITLVDPDVVSVSNINRQIIALHSTVGQYKTQVMKQRLEDINPSIRVHARNCFFTADNAQEIDFSRFDYIADAIDTVSSKLLLAQIACEQDIPIIASMGAGNKLDAAAFSVADIFSTSVDPLARVMRTELRKRGVKKLKVVYSEERPMMPLLQEITPGRRSTPGSVAFVPPSAGLIMAGEILKDLANQK